MHLDLVEKKDLDRFKEQLISEIEKIVNNSQNSKDQWLRSKQVCAMLSISQSSLQNLRITGVISYTKLNGIIFYDLAGINKMMEENKINRQNRSEQK